MAAHASTEMARRAYTRDGGIVINEASDGALSPDLTALVAVMTGRESFELPTGSESFLLILHNSPINPDVETLVTSRDGRILEEPTCRRIELDLTIKDVPYIRKLAKAIKKIVGRGESYSNKNWKWVCLRIAEALERLAFRLHSFGRIRN